MKKIILTLGVLACGSAFANNSNSVVWQDLPSNAQSQLRNIAAKNALKRRAMLLDAPALKNQLLGANNNGLSSRKFGAENATAKKSTDTVIDLPLPNGEFVKVKATESSILSAELAEQFSDIKTWRVVGLDDPAISGRIDFTTKGFHGMLTMPDGDTVYIDPDKQSTESTYHSLSKRENTSHFPSEFNCKVHDDHAVSTIENTEAQQHSAKLLASIPTLDLITYRLALAGTAEYTASQGKTKASAYASMVTTINRVNQIYERDLGITLQLVSGEQLIYTNSALDPYTNNDANALVSENMANLATNFGLGNFDLGHVFAQGSIGGLAFVGAACVNQANTSAGLVDGIKAGGATGTTNPQGETFSIEYVAHEMGHQFGATHTFNSTQNGCSGANRTAETAVEPGSGSTIMSYSGLCGTDDLQYNSEATFHFASISQINSYTRNDAGNTCGTASSTGNQNPVADAGTDINIPANTPFILDGSSKDGSSYSWDQTDTGAASAVDVDTGDNAIIRTLLPSADEDRYIPRLSDLFAGTNTIGEMLPQTTRELNFTYVVRDNSGGVGIDSKKVNVTNTLSTFSVVSQSSDETLLTGQSIDVLWNTAFTNTAPINCTSVDIQLLREDGVINGLLAATENDGIQTVTIPATTPDLSGARMMVACSDKSFFNIGEGDITVQKSSVDTIAPVITVLGDNPVSIPQGSAYTDAGATAVDDIDGNLTVSTTGTVDTAVAGAYTITYSAVDSSGNAATIIRNVNVTAVSVAIDTVAPVITLDGDTTVTLEVGQVYTDPGFTAVDDLDGVVSVTVTGIETLDTSKAGEYVITYTATDNAGNTIIEKRTIVVTEAGADLTANNLKSDSGGGSFGYLLLPLLIVAGLRRLKLLKVRNSNI